MITDGQTGSGKTYSMEGKLGSPIRGIVPRCVESIFQQIEQTDELYEFVVCFCLLVNSKIEHFCSC